MVSKENYRRAYRGHGLQRHRNQWNFMACRGTVRHLYNTFGGVFVRGLVSCVLAKEGLNGGPLFLSNNLEG